MLQMRVSVIQMQQAPTEVIMVCKNDIVSD